MFRCILVTFGRRSLGTNNNVSARVSIFSGILRDLFTVFTGEKVNKFECGIHASKQREFLLEHNKKLFTNIRELLAIYKKVLFVFDIAAYAKEALAFIWG